MNIFQKSKLKGLKKKLEKFNQLRDEGDNTAAQKQIHTLMDLAHFYLVHQFDKHLPHANDLALECYRQAGMLGHAEAQYQFADHMMKKGNFWRSLATTPLSAKRHEQYAEDCYKEALAHALRAQEQGHILAKRLHGLAYMRGWGVETNTEKGAELIIESIKEEGTFDRASKIFEELGLHSPEIFASLMSHHHKDD